MCALGTTNSDEPGMQKGKAGAQHVQGRKRTGNAASRCRASLQPQTTNPALLTGWAR